jgi:hypothetical protein
MAALFRGLNEAAGGIAPWGAGEDGEFHVLENVSEGDFSNDTLL